MPVRSHEDIQAVHDEVSEHFRLNRSGPSDGFTRAFVKSIINLVIQNRHYRTGDINFAASGLDWETHDLAKGVVKVLEAYGDTLPDDARARLADFKSSCRYAKKPVDWSATE